MRRVPPSFLEDGNHKLRKLSSQVKSGEGESERKKEKEREREREREREL